MCRCEPSVKKYPRLFTPTSTPTVTSAMVLTTTTRNPASSTGPARGSSTTQNRCHAEYPIAVADCRTSASTDPKASAAERDISATA